jgi:hypothetical protein
MLEFKIHFDFHRFAEGYDVVPDPAPGLAFGIHLFIHEEARSTSSLELCAGEVKNGETEVAFDIPSHVVKLLMEYRDRIAPKLLGTGPGIGNVSL